MDSKSYKEEIIEHYIDQDLQVTVDKDPSKWSTGNGLLHSGLFICLLAHYQELEESDIARFNAAVSMCQTVPGVYNRNPGRDDQNAHDDSVGIAAASAICKLGFHKDILDHGVTKLFFYDNVNNKFNGLKDLWSWRLRFPFIILWYYLINRKLTVLDFILKAYLNWSSSKDSNLLHYCMVESMASIYPKWRTIKTDWLKKNNLTEALASYFGSEHPLVQLSKGI